MTKKFLKTINKTKDIRNTKKTKELEKDFRSLRKLRKLDKPYKLNQEKLEGSEF